MRQLSNRIKNISPKRNNTPAGINKMGLFFIVLILSFTACKEEDSEPLEEEKPPIEISPGDVDVVAYYFPNWGPLAESEWPVIRRAKPQFEGHKQPKVPVWGYENEQLSPVMEKKIEVASEHGIDVFIFDWYYFDPSNIETDDGKYLYKALENGFMGASNNSDIKFALMWCNHDVGNMKGAVKPATFEAIIDYVIENYFHHPSYWKIDGCPYFSVYLTNKLLESYDNSYTSTAQALETFRSKVKAAGFPDLHLNGVLFGLGGGSLNNSIEQLNINSTTSYVWIHHNALPDFPATEYETAADDYFTSLALGGAANGLENPVSAMEAPYHINVTMGWDASPRCRNSDDWMTRRDYPFGPVIVNNNPYLFKKYLARAKALTMEKPEKERIITINSWNEWGEGSYLEPDIIHGMKYLEAIKEVFNTN
jgi:hypothetical protein